MISPVWFGPRVSPVSGSTIFTSIFGKAVPTVLIFLSNVSSALVWVNPGAASVRPYTLVISGMCIFSMASFIVSTGQVEPAMIPVLSEDMSNMSNIGWFIIPMNMVGTP